METREFEIARFRRLPSIAGRADGDLADPDRFEIAISSEFPVRRWFGKEILDHSPEAVDLSRAKIGLSFLDSHESHAIVGIVKDVRLENKVLRGVVQFSRNPKAQEVKRDVVDGIRKYISVGYAVNEYTLEKSSKDEGDTYRATSWTPLEASSVAVPADPSVGHNRKAGERGFPVKPKFVENHSVEVSAEHDGEDFSMATATASRPTAERQATPRFTLTEKELREYSLARAILVSADNQEGSERAERNCFELEVSQELEKHVTGKRYGGVLVPWNLSAGEFARKGTKSISTRAGLDSKTSTTGTELKFTKPGDFLDYLYNRMRVKELGATTVTGLRDNVAFPKQTGKATGSWVAENPGSDVADSNLTLGQVLSSPKTYQSSTSYSRQLLAQAVIDVDTTVRRDLAQDMALALDFGAIAGPTGGSSPLGLMNTTGVQAFVVAADSGNGGAVAYVDVLKMLEDLEDVNADQLGDPGWLTTPGIKTDLKNTTRLANLIAIPVWTDNDEVAGYMARSSNQVPKTGVRGSTSNNHALIVGVWSTMQISMWGSGFELVVDPFRLKKQGMIELTTFMLADIVLKYPPAFVVAQVQK
jgi:HK97 family phage major capsid protein